MQRLVQDVCENHPGQSVLIASADETAVQFNNAPRSIFTGIASQRGDNRPAGPGENDRLRFTALLFSAATVHPATQGDGIADSIGPSFNIVKSSASNPRDLTNTRVLNDMLRNFEKERPNDCPWSLKVWEKTLPVKQRGSKEYQDTLFKRPYLINTETGDIITLQNKAWMDTAGVIMWLELVWKPWVDLKGCPVILLWDGVGVHKTRAALEFIEREKLLVHLLLPNTTDEWQVSLYQLHASS